MTLQDIFSLWQILVLFLILLLGASFRSYNIYSCISIKWQKQEPNHFSRKEIKLLMILPETQTNTS